jgi:hypothetical protein
MIFYVKKIVSLNPKKYKFVDFDEVTEKYQEYIRFYIKSLPVNKRLELESVNRCKTMDEWLETEI